MGLSYYAFRFVFSISTILELNELRIKCSTRETHNVFGLIGYPGGCLIERPLMVECKNNVKTTSLKARLIDR